MAIRIRFKPGQSPRRRDVIGGGDPEYFVVALQGQSGVKYATGLERNPYNPTGMLRPTISGSKGFAVQMEGGQPDGVVVLEVNNANFQNESGGYIVSRGAYAITEFMQFMAPTRIPVFLELAKSGRAMSELVNDDDADWMFSEYKTAVDYVAANYGPADLLVTFWYGSAPTHIDPATWTGVLADGSTQHIPGRRSDNTVGEPGVDHYLMRPPGDPNRALAAFDQGATGPKLAYALHPNPNLTAALRANVTSFFAGARFDGMNLGEHTIPMSGHIDGAIPEGQPLQALMVMGPPILKALGRTVLTPAIETIHADPDGAYVDVTVSLPNGGNLTTIRAQNSLEAPASPGITYLPIYGFEYSDLGTDDYRSNLRRTGPTAWTAAITDPGTGTAPSRTGTVRLTPTGWTVRNGSKLTYRMGGNGADGIGNAGITRSGSTARASVPLGHGFSAGQSVTISGATQSEYNGVFTIATVPSPYEFTYTVSGTPATDATGTITAQVGAGPVHTLGGIVYGTEAGGDNPMADQVFFNHLIEEVPAWRQAGVEWPFPGIEVAPMATTTALSVGAGVVPLSSATMSGTATPNLPPDLAADDLVVLIAGSHSNTPPALPAGWDDVTIGGDGAAGANLQVSFRVCTRVWQAGDTMPTFSGANYADAHRLPNTFAVGAVASDFENATSNPVPGVAATAPAVDPLTAGTSHRHMLHVASRHASQSGYGASGALSTTDGFNRISNESTGMRTTWIKPDPVVSIPAITLPVAFSSTNGGGVLTIELYRP